MTDQTLEQRARGLLASEFPLADGFSAVLVRDMSIPQLGVVDTAIALRAIVAALQAQQPGAQAVAWHTDDHLTDKSATTYDPVIADRWRAKGWPVTPHYTDPQPPSIPEPSEDDVEAAKDAFDDVYDGMPGSDRPSLRAALATYTARLRAEVKRLDAGWREAVEVANSYAEQFGVHERERDALRARAERAEGRIASAPIAIMDTRDALGLCAPTEEDFPSLYALHGKTVALVVVND